MSEIIDFSELQAKNFEKISKRIVELERLTHVCTITINSIIDIQSPDRFLFSGIVEKYKKSWERELEILKRKINP